MSSLCICFFFFKQKTAYEMLRSLVGSEMCIRDRRGVMRWRAMTTPPLLLFLGTITVATGAQTRLIPGFRIDDHAPNSGWTVHGSATENDDALLLTTHAPEAAGVAWSKRVMTANRWEITFTVNVKGPDQETGKVGEGIALWMTPHTPGPEPPSAERLAGLPELFSGFALYMDTKDDDGKRDNPIIMTVKNDGTQKFAHDKDGAGSRMGGCRVKYLSLIHI
eukprot:TRINITY_DN26034_c0_g1_i3.p2 TRINITY_DN26034_c0_g1~~TRINITY_DN26034_c0_g1_i3.p2  ORF type:complete len:221 (-),score=64.86 TRINITY_DN26034_c0_g1_i3:146-808(-)